MKHWRVTFKWSHKSVWKTLERIVRDLFFKRKASYWETTLLSNPPWSNWAF